MFHPSHSLFTTWSFSKQWSSNGLSQALSGHTWKHFRFLENNSETNEKNDLKTPGQPLRFVSMLELMSNNSRIWLRAVCWTVEVVKCGRIPNVHSCIMVNSSVVLEWWQSLYSSLIWNLILQCQRFVVPERWIQEHVQYSGASVKWAELSYESTSMINMAVQVLIAHAKPTTCMQKVVGWSILEGGARCCFQWCTLLFFMWTGPQRTHTKKLYEKRISHPKTEPMKQHSITS